MSTPVSELRRRYLKEGAPLPAAMERALAEDPRAGARQVLASILRRREKEAEEQQRLHELLNYERVHWADGRTVVGLDEVGMGPMAGPVVAAAVILPPDASISRIDDSKRLTAEHRESLAPIIRQTALAWGLGAVPPAEIDDVGLHRAGLLAMERAAAAMGMQADAALVDGVHLPDLGIPCQAIIKGDRLSMSIAAASILAKTTRDAHMVAMDKTFPGYGFAKHKGYPVAQHKDALAALGPTPIHRRCFAVVREADEAARYCSHTPSP